MPLNVGILGAGNIGSAHALRLSTEISGARVAAVYDTDAPRAAALADKLDATVSPDPETLIADDAVDAVVIAAPGPTHAPLTIACIAARKPVLCEKPLAETAEASRAVLDAERTYGTRLVQLGFMRRFDLGYRRLRQAILERSIGEVIVAHCVHRNATSALGFTSSMLLTDSAIHEIDIMRYLLGEELVAVQVLAPKRSPLAAEGLQDPQLVLLESASGIVTDVEVFVNCRYGYEVRCEVVGSLGAASLDIPSTGSLTFEGARRTAIAADWRDRFADAYRQQLQHFVDGARAGSISGPSVWDGYAATVVAASCVRALHRGERELVVLGERPPLYREEVA